jgi:outer membrane protein
MVLSERSFSKRTGRDACPTRRSVGVACAAVLALAWLPPPRLQAQEAQPLGLDDVLTYAVNHNPKIAAAVAHLSGAQAAVDAARAGAQPAVTLRASGQLQVPVPKISISVRRVLHIPPWVPVRIPPIQFDIGRAEQGSIGVGVVWPIWTGGRVEAAVGAARAQADASEADLQQATEQLLYEAGAGYFEVLQARQAAAAAEAALRRAQEALRTAEVARDAGLVTVASVSAAQAAQRDAEQRRALAATAVVDAEQSLNDLMGRGLDEPVAIVDEPITLDLPATEEEATEVALSMRPELLALESRREAAAFAVAQARAERMPSLSFAAQAALQTKTPFTPANQESIGLQFSWPVLVYGASYAHERQARAATRETAELIRDLQSSVVYQAETTARRIADARERVAAATVAEAAAEASAREVSVARAAGAATREQLTAAESSLEEARARRAQAEAGLSIAQLSRARALGLLRAILLVSPEKGGRP